MCGFFGDIFVKRFDWLFGRYTNWALFVSAQVGLGVLLAFSFLFAQVV